MKCINALTRLTHQTLCLRSVQNHSACLTFIKNHSIIECMLVYAWVFQWGIRLLILVVLNSSMNRKNIYLNILSFVNTGMAKVIENCLPGRQVLVYSSQSWWRHQSETFSALLALCAGNSPVPVNSPLKGQWRGALIFSYICARINDWVNNREAGDLRRHRGHYDVIVMWNTRTADDSVTKGTRALVQYKDALLPVSEIPLWR